jgi:PRTRC genetic system protein A
MIAALSALLRHHIATEAAPLPEPAPGICWIWAAGGIYKRGQDATRTVIVRVGEARSAPGLVPLLPCVQWHGYPYRLPGQLLTAMLLHARKAAAPIGGNGLLRPIEAQYHVTLEAGKLKVRVPEQDATPGRVTYQLPEAPVLLDLHSHHAMPAFFSGTDNRDDTGLGVSAVIGRIFDPNPEVIVRLCCYGHTQIIPALAIFDSLGSFRDKGASDADVDG